MGWCGGVWHGMYGVWRGVDGVQCGVGGMSGVCCDADGVWCVGWGVVRVGCPERIHCQKTQKYFSKKTIYHWSRKICLCKCGYPDNHCRPYNIYILLHLVHTNKARHINLYIQQVDVVLVAETALSGCLFNVEVHRCGKSNPASLQMIQTCPNDVVTVVPCFPGERWRLVRCSKLDRDVPSVGDYTDHRLAKSRWC